MSLYHRLINQLINNVRQMVARQIDCGLNLQFIFVEVFSFGFLVLFQPGDFLVDSLFDLFFILVSDFGAELFFVIDLIFERVSVRLQFIAPC